MAEHFAKALGQPFVILNRDGAAGVIGVEAVASAKPDGYTWATGRRGSSPSSPTCARASSTRSRISRFLCQSNTGAFSIVAGPNSPYNSLAELIGRRAGARQDQLRLGRACHRPHLIAESIALEAG